MNCQDAEHAIALAVGGDLEPEATLELDHHLESCRRCRAWRRDLEASQDELKTWAMASPDEMALAKLRTAVLEQVENEPRDETRRSVRGPLQWLAAALLVGLGLTIWLVFQLDPASRPADAGTSGEPIRVAEHLPDRHHLEPDRQRLTEGRSPEDRHDDEDRYDVEDRPDNAALTLQTVPPVPRVLQTDDPPAPSPLSTSVPVPAPVPGPVPGSAPGVPTAHEATRGPTSRPVVAGPTETTLVKLITDDPDILIYWLIETETPTEES